MTAKIIDINELKTQRKLRDLAELNAEQDPTMDAWIKGILVGHQLRGDKILREYFLRGLALGFETGEQDAN